jgi:hypothetical protein
MEPTPQPTPIPQHIAEEVLKIEKSYFQQRMDLLGITDKINAFEVYNPDAEFPQRDTDYIDIFSEDENGNIKILVYDLEAELINFTKYGEGKTGHINAKIRPYHVTRLKEPIIRADGKMQKYAFPKGVKETHPFFPPWLCDKYKDEKATIETLIITEGYFKAFKGQMHDFDIVGLSSITHYKENKAGTLHSDILKLINKKKPKNIIILYDGDCKDISTKAFTEGKDLYTRPAGFFNSAKAIRELLKDIITKLEIDLYFAHVNSGSIPGEPKGLDDLLCAVNKEVIPEILEDLKAFSKPGHYFHKINITNSVGPVQAYLSINNATAFYTTHNQILQDKEFAYLGTKYRWNHDKAELEIIIPGAAKNYFRVGDQYYEKIQIPNKYNQMEKTYHRRQKTTITDDHGKNFVKHVSKYKAFCNVPDHLNYQEVMHNCYNVYSPFEHTPEEGECPVSIDFVKHIFGEQWLLGLDYIQLLYQKPTHILPILCLVSSENNTGKSTFGKWMKAIFDQNMAVIGNAELANDFNASWATRLIVCCEESFIDKKTVIERIKSLSTADKIMVNAKGKDHVEIDFFGKFMLFTNNEENFIYASEEDIRYWVRKIAKPVTDNPNLLIDLIEEIPYFLYFLNKRQMEVPESQSRMWFKPEQIKTEALKKLQLANQSTVEREIRKKIREMFLDFGLETILMTNKVICKDFFKNKYEESYVEKVLKHSIKVDTYTNDKGEKVTKRYKYPRWEEINREGRFVKEIVLVDDTGRPFVFKREDFVSTDDETAVDPELLADIKHIKDILTPKHKAPEPSPEQTEIFNNDDQDLPF